MQERVYARRLPAPIWAPIAVAALFLICLFSLPGAAFAKSYSMPSVGIRATMEADGSLHVVEERIFDFDGAFSCVWWDFDSMYDKELQPNSVALSFPEGGGVSQELAEVPFETDWRYEGGPAGAAYSFDETYDAVYVFFDAADTQMTVRFDYTVKGAVDVYNDCADMYWKFVGPDWAEDSRNVSCVIELPVHSGKMVPGETARAWGHGPLSGSVAFAEDGSSVSYEVPRVRSGEFAEARIVFPPEWLSLDANYPIRHYSRLDYILDEEKSEASAANRGRIISLLFFGLLGMVSLASIAWSAIKLVVDGIEHKPNFADSYWRDVPNKEVHPAVIARLCRWNRESPDDVLATILHLANLGAVQVNRGVKGADGMPRGRYQADPDAQESYYLQLNPDVADSLSDPIDKNLLGFLFGDIAPDYLPLEEGALWLEDIDAWGEAHAKSFHNKVESWQKLVTRKVKEQGYFEEKGEANQGSAWALAIALAVAGAWISFEVAGNFWPLIVFGVTAVVVFALSINMPRRTQNGAEDYAHAMGLKKWLRDFTLLGERLPTDVKVWGEYMVYAQLFGVAKETMRHLRTAMPELFAHPEASALDGPVPVSWHAWYDADVSAAVGGESFSRSFSEMWSSTLAAADTAHFASTGGGGFFSGGGFSSGGGGGGGFSGGGGGGFGGGGGGAR